MGSERSRTRLSRIQRRGAEPSIGRTQLFRLGVGPFVLTTGGRHEWRQLVDSLAIGRLDLGRLALGGLHVLGRGIGNKLGRSSRRWLGYGQLHGWEIVIATAQGSRDSQAADVSDNSVRESHRGPSLCSRLDAGIGRCNTQEGGRFLARDPGPDWRRIIVRPSQRRNPTDRGLSRPWPKALFYSLDCKKHFWRIDRRLQKRVGERIQPST
jgi:hypothetical protein